MFKGEPLVSALLDKTAHPVCRRKHAFQLSGVYKLEQTRIDISGWRFFYSTKTEVKVPKSNLNVIYAKKSLLKHLSAQGKGEVEVGGCLTALIFSEKINVREAHRIQPGLILYPNAKHIFHLKHIIHLRPPIRLKHCDSYQSAVRVGKGDLLRALAALHLLP